MELAVATGGFLENVERLYNELRTNHRNELQKQRDEAQSEERKLRAEIAALQGRLSTHDELLQENIRLRQTLLEQQRIVPTPETDKVHIDQYRALQSRCELYAQKLHQANVNGEQYRLRCHELQTKRNREKETIKTWQDYHASLESRRRAHTQVSSLFDAVGKPPQVQHLGDGSPVPGSPTKPTSSSSIAKDLPHQARPTGTLSTIAEEHLQVEQDPEEHVRDPPSSPPLPQRGQDDENVLEEQAPPAKHGNGQEQSKESEVKTKRTVIRSSQSTDVEAKQNEISPPKPAAVPIEEDPEPEILSVRATKRKRRASPLSRATAPPKTIHIKDEGGSSPIHQSIVGRMNQQESIDLDNVIPDFMTPRKRRKLSEMRQSLHLSPRREREMDILRHERSNSMPASLEQHRNSGVDRHSAEEACVANDTLSDRDPKRRTTASGNRQRHHAPDSGPHEQEEQENMQQQRHGPTEVLQHLDVNKPVQPRTSESKSNRKRGRGRGPIHELTEDGERYSRQRSSKNGAMEEAQQPSPVDVFKGKRLHGLLDEGSSSPRSVLTPSRQVHPEKQETANIRTTAPRDDPKTHQRLAVKQRAQGQQEHQGAAPQSFSAAGKQRLGKLDQSGASISPSKPPAPTNRHKPFPWDQAPQRSSTGERAAVLLGATTTPASESRTPKPAPTTTGKLKTPTTAFKSRQTSRISAAPAETPNTTTSTTTTAPLTGKGKLRTLSPSRLRPSDFRINPAANHGYDYAFADTVRKPGEKRCAPGCTKPECCGGKFSKMLQIGGPLKTRGRSLWDPSSSQEDPDEALLRDFMGDNYAVVASMTAAKRNEMVMKARTAELAGRVGKHRQQWQRSRTPPGFWRTDFPSTQENVRDREEVARREREEVEERRREAMRRGKWKFADE